MTAPTPPDARRHIPALDGLRAIAVLLVLVHHFVQNIRPIHAFESWLFAWRENGWVGVDLFFCLSGFLITGILADSLASPHYYRSFYGRRLLRIFPLHYLYLAAVFWFLPLLDIDRAPHARAQQLWFWCYGSNLLTAWHGWQDRWLSHFWTLAIEEQYYLVWPLLLRMLPPDRWRRALTWGLILGLVARVWYWNTEHNPTLLFTHSLTHLDGLCLGSLTALWVRQPDWRTSPFYQRYLRHGGTEFLAGLALAWFFLGDLDWRTWHPVMQVLGLPIVAIACWSLLFTCIDGQPTSLLHKLVTTRPMQFIGRISYGVYIFHIPVGTWGRKWLYLQLVEIPVVRDCPLPVFVVVLTLVTLGIAWVSWTVFEKPLLRLRRVFPYAGGDAPRG